MTIHARTIKMLLDYDQIDLNNCPEVYREALNKTAEIEKKLTDTFSPMQAELFEEYDCTRGQEIAIMAAYLTAVGMQVGFTMGDALMDPVAAINEIYGEDRLGARQQS